MEDRERESKIMQLCIERDRLIYWLLRAWVRLEAEASTTLLDTLDRTLTAFGYRPDGPRAAQMLKLGEPGCYIATASSWLSEDKE